MENGEEKEEKIVKGCEGKVRKLKMEGERV